MAGNKTHSKTRARVDVDRRRLWPRRRDCVIQVLAVDGQHQGPTRNIRNRRSFVCHRRRVRSHWGPGVYGPDTVGLVRPDLNFAPLFRNCRIGRSGPPRFKQKQV